MFGDLKLEVYDGQGALVSTLPAGKRKGINRVLWPMRLKQPRMPGRQRGDPVAGARSWGRACRRAPTR